MNVLFLHYFVRISVGRFIIFWNVNNSNLKLKKMFLLIFRNSEIVNNLKMAVMSIFSKRNKGKNSDTPLPQSIEIGYHKNKKSVTTYVFECCISSLKPVVFQIYWLQTLRKWKYRFFKRSRDFTLVTCSESHVWKSLTLSQQLA